MGKVPAQFEVLLLDSAERDLEDIHSYIGECDSLVNADHVLDRLMEAVESLADFPDRGSVPKELAGLGIKEFRQVLFKPYRLVYRIVERKVVVYLIADGRRDMQSLLSRRLLG